MRRAGDCASSGRRAGLLSYNRHTARARIASVIAAAGTPHRPLTAATIIYNGKPCASRTEANAFGNRWSMRGAYTHVYLRLSPEVLVLMNNDVAEQPQIQASGLLPLRRCAPCANLSSRDPALHGMTDFTDKCPITVAPERPIDEALTDMMRFGVRALLVNRGDSVVGLITSYDIEGERPAAFSRRSSIVRREYIRVVDVMTEWNDVPTMDWTTMQSARVGDLLEIFHGIGVTHLLVVEGEQGGGGATVRGLVSRTRLERRLGRLS